MTRRHALGAAAALPLGAAAVRQAGRHNPDLAALASALREYRTACRCLDETARNPVRPRADRSIDRLDADLFQARRLAAEWRAIGDAEAKACAAIRALCGGPKPSPMGSAVEAAAAQAVRLGDVLAVAVAPEDDNGEDRLVVLDAANIRTFD